MQEQLGMRITPAQGYSHAARLLNKYPTANRVKHPAENIRWREVESSNVEAVGWDDDMHLYARFRGGRVYLYEGVSRQRSVACAYAPSVGSYFERKIKPHYKAVRIG